MDRSVALACGRNLATISIGTIVKRLMILGALALFCIRPARPQNAELQQKLAAAKRTAAENKQRLLQYQTVNQDGVPLQQDLGKSTTETATAMTEFDPDTSGQWGKLTAIRRDVILKIAEIVEAVGVRFARPTSLT